MDLNDFEDFNPFGLDYRNNPWTFYPRLLKASPGFINMEGVPSVFVAKHAHCKSVLLDFKRFSSKKPANLPGMERVDFFNSFPVMNYSDPPDHQRLRRLVSGAFSPQRIMHYGRLAEDVSERIIEGLGEISDLEVMGDITKPLSKKLLLSHFMGVEEQDQYIFIKYMESLVLLDKVPPGGSKPKAFLDAWEDGVRYCAAAVEKARRDKAQNLIGLLAQAFDDGGKLSNDEMMAMLVVLFIGGVTTVASAAGSALVNLARYPHVAKRIRENPRLAAPHLEESLRTDSVVSLVLRFTLEDIELGGKIIKKGMPVYVMIAAACYDPEVFAEPEMFNIDRDNQTEHLAFGQGLHTCIGNTIVRSTLPKLINLMANRYQNLHLPAAEDIKYESNPRARHLATARLMT